jgi:hypothetical protein
LQVIIFTAIKGSVPDLGAGAIGFYQPIIKILVKEYFSPIRISVIPPISEEEFPPIKKPPSAVATVDSAWS